MDIGGNQIIDLTITCYQCLTNPFYARLLLLDSTGKELNKKTFAKYFRQEVLVNSHTWNYQLFTGSTYTFRFC